MNADNPGPDRWLRGSSLAHEAQSLATVARARACNRLWPIRCVLRHPAHECSSNDRAIGHAGQLLYVLGLVDSETDADWFLGDALELTNIRLQIGRQPIALAGDAGDREIV